MAERSVTYFVSDVHLGLKVGDPAEREQRFVSFLKDIPRDTTRSLYLLGDIWDFWYEYRDVIPKEGIRVVSQLLELIAAGVEVYFIEGNHDMWSYRFFQEMGIRKLEQPYMVEIDGLKLCLGHGDRLGKLSWNVRLMNSAFHSRVVRALFSSLHPWVAYRFGTGWSTGNRKTHKQYHFRGEQEPLYQFALGYAAEHDIDCFIFGHYHDAVDMMLPSGQRFIILKDWIDGGQPHARLQDGVISF